MNRKLFGFVALAFVLLAGLATAGVLYAQQSGGMMGMMKSCPMMGAMQESPARALEHREALELTADQVQRLEALREGAQQARMRSMERMEVLHGEIAAATSGDRFDEAAVRSAFERMGDLHTEMGVAMLRTRHDVRQVLTAEQRQELGELGGGMQGMMGGGMMGGGMMGGGVMENCPMMKGGMMGEGMDHMQMEEAGSGSMEPHHQS